MANSNSLCLYCYLLQQYDICIARGRGGEGGGRMQGMKQAAAATDTAHFILKEIKYY